MSERVEFRNGIIYQHADKKGLTVEFLKEDLKALLLIQDELKKTNAPLLMLYDGANVKKADSAVRAQALYNMSNLDYKRVAVIGVKSVFLYHMAKLIIFGMAKQKKIKIFSDREEAEKWLRNGKRKSPGGMFVTQKNN